MLLSQQEGFIFTERSGDLNPVSEVLHSTHFHSHVELNHCTVEINNKGDSFINTEKSFIYK